MRAFWFWGITLAGAACVALVMLAANIGFAAAGNIPEIETCGFLSGPLLLLFFLYPLCAGIVASRAVSPLARRFAQPGEPVAQCGTYMGLWGSLAYFGASVMAAAGSPHPRYLPPVLWLLMALYIALCALGGRIGASIGVQRARVPVATGDGG